MIYIFLFPVTQKCTGTEDAGIVSQSLNIRERQQSNDNKANLNINQTYSKLVEGCYLKSITYQSTI